MPAQERAPGRLAFLDAYRGLVMLAMISGGLGLTTVAELSQQHDVEGDRLPVDHAAHRCAPGDPSSRRSRSSSARRCHSLRDRRGARRGGRSPAMPRSRWCF